MTLQGFFYVLFTLVLVPEVKYLNKFSEAGSRLWVVAKEGVKESWAQNLTERFSAHLLVTNNKSTTHRQLQDFVEHNIWRDVEVEHKVLKRGKEDNNDDDDDDDDIFHMVDNKIALE